MKEGMIGWECGQSGGGKNTYKIWWEDCLENLLEAGEDWRENFIEGREICFDDRRWVELD